MRQLTVGITVNRYFPSRTPQRKATKIGFHSIGSGEAMDRFLVGNAVHFDGLDDKFVAWRKKRQMVVSI